MNKSMQITCPSCSGTGTNTHDDRHAGTNMDTCATCGGEGVVDPKTGQSEAAAFRWTMEDVEKMTPGQKRFAEKILTIAKHWRGTNGGIFTINAMANELAVRLWDEPSEAGWEETARKYAQNADFYRGIVDTIGSLFGDKVKTSDDGSLQQEVLALKVFDAVRHLLDEVIVLRRQRMAPERERELLEANNRYLERARTAERAIAASARVDDILAALLVPSDDPEHGTRDHLPRVLRDFLNTENGRAGLTGFNDGYAEGFAKANADLWVDRCAWIADKLLGLEGFEGLQPQRGDDGLAIAHLKFLATELRDRKVGSGTKCCRWLGWLQAGVCFHGFCSLEDMKELNLASGEENTKVTFQDRNLQFINMVAGDDPTDVIERRDRFAEEALELLQALNMGQQQVHELVHYVWSRPVGQPGQEMGGTYVTLAGLASYAGLDMVLCGEAELARCQQPEVIAKIRAKRASRVRGSVLPGTE